VEAHVLKRNAFTTAVVTWANSAYSGPGGMGGIWNGVLGTCGRYYLRASFWPKKKSQTLDFFTRNIAGLHKCNTIGAAEALENFNCFDMYLFPGSFPFLSHSHASSQNGAFVEVLSNLPASIIHDIFPHLVPLSPTIHREKF
jgi:hypothetical protein